MKRAVVLSDTIADMHYGGRQVFTKNASGLRLTYQLRKRNILTKPIYNFTAFTLQEFDHILESFSENKKHELVICLSTSFLATGIIKNKNSLETLYGVDIWGKDIYEKILLFCSLAKKKYKATVIMGGWVVHITPDKNISFECMLFKNAVDVFVIGDGTEIISKLCGYNTDIENHGTFIENKDTLAFIANSITDFSDEGSKPNIEDHINQQESLMTELAAGCIFSCSFCDYAYLGKKKHEFVRTYESLKKEFESNYKNFGTTVYTFTDNIMNDYPPKLEMLVKIKEELGIDIKWSGYARLDTIRNIQQVKLLQDSGMIATTFGVESFYKPAGPYIGKMTDGEKLKDSLRMIRQVFKDDLIISAAMIAGLPTETPEILNETYKYMNSTEGKYLIDNHVYSRLILFDNQGTKNEINAGRMNGDPFKDFKKNSPIDWTSPYGNSNLFSNLANKYNSNRKKAYIFAFNLPILQNLNLSLDTIINNKRNITDQPDLSSYINKKTSEKIKEYKQKILS